MLRYKQLKSVFFTDTLVSLSTKLTRGNIYAQVFVSDKGYIAVYPMQSQSEFIKHEICVYQTQHLCL